MGKLRDQMARDMDLKGFSPRTKVRYLSCVKGFVRYFGRSPDALGAEEIRTYLHTLIQEQKASRSTVAQAYSALKFLYTTTLGRDWEMDKIPRIKREKKLPVVLAYAEIEAIFARVGNLKHRAILMTIYSAGLRLSEAVHLKITTRQVSARDVVDAYLSQIRRHNGDLNSLVEKMLQGGLSFGRTE